MGARDGFRARAVHRDRRTGTPIYHTNVLMTSGTRVAVVALDAIARRRSRARQRRAWSPPGRDVIAIDHAEMRAFAGNMLEVGSWDEYLGDFTHPGDVAKPRATRWPRASTRACTRPWMRCSPLPIDVIERHGGGGVRCMLAEIFLP